MPARRGQLGFERNTYESTFPSHWVCCDAGWHGADCRPGPGSSPAAAQGSQGPQGPTFKVQVDYVEVDAWSPISNGRFVRDLKKEDFQIFEDGKPQTMNAFLAGRHSGRARRAPAVRRRADRARRQDQRAAVRGPRLHDGDRRTAHALERTVRVRRRRDGSSSRRLGANDLMAVIHVQAQAEDSPGVHQQQAAAARRRSDRFVGKARTKRHADEVSAVHIEYRNPSTRRSVKDPSRNETRLRCARDARGNEGPSPSGSAALGAERSRFC